MSLKTFLYFAYGSNLLSNRIHISNPSAVFKYAAKLDNYRLDFNYYSKRWKGCAATIVPENNCHVWGAVWELNNEHMENLDNQEGVHNGVYKVIKVNVTTPKGDKILCRCYELVDQPPPLGENEVLPISRQPSKIYLDTIIAGAKECNLPEEYISYLNKFPHNGYEGKVLYHKDD